MALSLADKLAFNAAKEAQAAADKSALDAWLNAIKRPTSENRQYYREQTRLIDDRLRDEKVQIDSADWGQNISVRSSDFSQVVAYGENRLGGLVSFLTADEGETGQFLHVFITLVGHEIDRFTQVYLDGERVSFDDSLVDGDGRKDMRWAIGDWENFVFASTKSRGANDQEANEDLVSQSAALFPGLWTSAHRQRHHAGIYLILKYDVLRFPNGFPEIAIEFRGRNDIFDPRDSSTGYTNNAALCLASFLMSNRFGPGFSINDFDLDNLKEAANICDELIPKSGGGSVKRYMLNGSFSVNSSNDFKSVISQMQLTMGGPAVWSGGKWWLYPGKWRIPVVSLNEGDLRSERVTITAKPSKTLVFNAVKGSYRGPESLWEVTDYPAVKNSTYEDQDGEQLIKEVDYRFVTSPGACQRLSKIKLEKGRQWIQVEADWSMKAYKARAGDNVSLSLERFGWSSKVFEVLERTFVPGNENSAPVVSLFLQETAGGVYDWNDGEETTIDLAPNTNLPSPKNVRQPTNIVLSAGTEELDIRADGTAFSRLKVSWDASIDLFVLSGGWHEIQYKKTSDDVWRTAGFVSGTENTFYILDVLDLVQYDVRVRALNGLARSAWTEEVGFLVIGKEENPSTVTNFTASFSSAGIRFNWDDIPDLDLDIYEIREFEGANPSWANGTPIYRARGNSFLYVLKAAGEYTFFIRAKDRSRNYSFDSASVKVQIASPGTVQNLSGTAIFNTVKLVWQEPATTTFPIAKYRIYKNSVFIGDAFATIKTLQEEYAGDVTYQVSAVDAYGNEGDKKQVMVNITLPPTFKLLSDVILLPSALDSVTNAAIENDDLVAPVLTEQTYSQHFTENGWTTPQEQIDAGYPIFIQPANTVESVSTWIYDFGETIDSCRIVLQYLAEWAAGSGDVTIDIGYSLDGISWTEEDTTSTVGENFRYVKIEITVAGDDDTSVARISNVRLRLEVTTTTDSGVVYADAGDGSGTLVTFNFPVLDVIDGSQSVSSLVSSAYFPTVVLSGNELRVFLWNTSGARVSGNVRWSADVVVSV